MHRGIMICQFWLFLIGKTVRFPGTWNHDIFSGLQSQVVQNRSFLSIQGEIFTPAPSIKLLHIVLHFIIAHS